VTNILSSPQRDGGEPQQSKIIEDKTSAPCGSRVFGIPHLSNRISSQLFLFGYLNYGFSNRCFGYSPRMVSDLDIGANKTLKELLLQNTETTIAHRVIVVYRTPLGPNADLAIEKLHLAAKLETHLTVSFQSEISWTMTSLPPTVRKHRLKFMCHGERNVNFSPAVFFLPFLHNCGREGAWLQLSHIYRLLHMIENVPFRWYLSVNYIGRIRAIWYLSTKKLRRDFKFRRK
jgi:hypothetical protein